MAEKKVPTPKYEYVPTTAHAVNYKEIIGELVPWEGNRPIDPKRVARIARHIAETRDMGPTPIVVGFVPGSRAGYVLDGQHRLRAISHISPEIAARIPICVCQVQCIREQLREVFKSLNCHTPVPMTFWDDDVNKFVVELLAEIARCWPGVIREGQKTCRPRITSGKLRALIVAEPRLREAAAAQILSTELARMILERLNTEEKDKLTGTPAQRAASALRLYGVSATTLATADTLDFHIGLITNWPIRFMSEVSRAWLTDIDGNPDAAADAMADE